MQSENAQNRKNGNGRQEVVYVLGEHTLYFKLTFHNTGLNCFEAEAPAAAAAL